MLTLAAPTSLQGRAWIESNVAYMLAIDGQTLPEPLYEADLEPGSHRLVVEYPTVLARYQCTFELHFETGQSYEIIARPDRFPVFVNRLQKSALFTSRSEKHAPEQCRVVGNP